MQQKTCNKCRSTRLAVDADPQGWAVCQSCGHSQWNGEEGKVVDETAPTIPPIPARFDPQLKITKSGIAMWEEQIPHSVVPSCSRRVNLMHLFGYYYPDESEGNRTVIMLPNGGNFFIYGDHREQLDQWYATRPPS